HNAGGGGGANLAAGNAGGKQSASGLSCQGNYPGRGGRGLPLDAARLYLGGGGGAGHTNNNGVGTAGGNGGAILIIEADKLAGNGFSIQSNGETPPLTPSDGGGGGGAGGTIVLRVSEIGSAPVIEAKGGNGGDITSQTDRCFGPGGGGGGGVLFSNLNTWSVNLAGGAPGVNMIVSNLCDGPSNGAGFGEDGWVNDFEEIPEGMAPIGLAGFTQQPENQEVCENEEAFFVCEMPGESLFFQWQADFGSGFEDLNDGAVFNGSQSPVLSVFPMDMGLTGLVFRCLVSNNCGEMAPSDTAVLTIQPLPEVAFSFNQTSLFTIEFVNLSNNALSVEWDFGDGHFSDENNPVHVFDSAGIYTVRLTASNDCGSVTFEEEITLGTPPAAQFSADQREGCAPMVVHFSDNTVGDVTFREWHFPGGMPNISNEKQPEITYLTPGVFNVELIVGNIIGKDTILKNSYVIVEIFPEADFDFQSDELVVEFENKSVGGLNFFWDFGDGGTSDEPNPVHEYAAPGNYEVQLTVTSFNCGSTVKKTLVLVVDAVGENPETDDILVFPNPAKNRIFVQSESGVSGQKTIVLWSSNGLKVRELKDVWGARHLIHTEGLPAGIYYLEVIDKNHLVRKRIIVQ
ncbi:MAG: PKD domain-containing protein, partial [Bacteroidetes bacterium]